MWESFRPIPDFNVVFVPAGKVFEGRDEPELPEDMLHDGAGHHHPDIVPVREPGTDKVLGIALVPAGR